MRPLLTMAALFVVSASAFAQAAKPCEELKAEIVKKLEAKSVQSYSLDIKAKDDKEGDGKVVGTCEGGTKKIVYTRTTTPAKPPAAEATKP
ncbi:MAG TPA: DUF1161 domain-containing protein [Candidatus Sulfotelmatobacter sp.]|nr:DUF1161 domain-containing protein [Candidatus Sulfotelmatobacter sp.]